MFSAGNPKAPDNVAEGLNRTELFAAVAACIENAALRQSTVILRYSTALDSIDPWLYLQTSPAWWQAWHNGSTGLSLAAYGVALSYDVQSLHEASQTCSQLSEQVSIAGDTAGVSTAPFALVGHSFDGRTTNESEWAEWPTTSVVIPEVMIVRHASTAPCHVVITQTIHAKTCPETLTNHICTLVNGIRQITPDPSAVSHSGIEYLSSANESQVEWAHRVGRAKRAIEQDALTKVVLARKERVETVAGKYDPYTTLLNLRRQHPGGYCFAISRGNQCFLGASPERLVAANDGVVTTHALAGTVARGLDAAQDRAMANQLLNSQKDRHEQQLVTTMLVHALESVCTEVTHDPTPELVRLPHVQHLSTPISGKLRNGHHILELVDRLHPTPAVCGAPVAEAQQWLFENEAMVRGWYSGPVGWVGQRGTGDFCVAIRSALMTANRTYVYAGAGIVPESDASLEWQETSLKLQTMLSALACSEVDSDC